MNVPNMAGAQVDWPSLGWVLVLAAITAACLYIKKAYPRLSGAHAATRVMAHVVIGYFSVGMLAFGAMSALQARLPVPGGVAWQGPVAVIGGLAACVIGGTTLAEHALQVASLHRAARPKAQPVVVTNPGG